MKAHASCFASILSEKNAVCTWENLEISKQQSILQATSPTPPLCVVYPQTQAQLATVIAEAYRNHWQVLVCGNGSKLTWGGLTKKIDIVVSTERINQLIEHAVGDLTVTVEAGMRFSQLQKILAASNQFIALDPTAPESATIGGIVATADTGSLRQRYHSVRDQLLGITIVRADGQIAKAGGRVVKNVAGYDLMKLFTGSYGTLGLIAELTFRVYPLPQMSETVVLSGSAEDVYQAANILRNSALTPSKADLLSSQLMHSLGLGTGLGLVACFQSIPESVKEQSDRLLEVGQKLGLQGITYTAGNEADLWLRLAEQMHHHSNIVCKIGVLPTAAVEILTQAELGLIHIASGLGVLGFASEKGVLQMRKQLESHQGFLTILAATPEVKQNFDVWGYSGNALQLMKRIKEQFDPQYILSPGRFVGGL